MTDRLHFVQERRYLYEFRITVAENSHFHPDTVRILEVFTKQTMQEDDAGAGLTEADFNELRHNLQVDGFILHEITRIPYHEPEPVA